jgi:hypothetical protein
MASSSEQPVERLNSWKKVLQCLPPHPSLLTGTGMLSGFKRLKMSLIQPTRNGSPLALRERFKNDLSVKVHKNSHCFSLSPFY